MNVGQFIGKAVGVEYGRTNNGNEYVAVAMQCGDEMGTWIGYLNTDENIERTLSALRTMGWAGSDAGAITVADLPGYVQVDVRQDKDKEGKLRFDDAGKPIGRPAFINPVTGRTIGVTLDQGARKAIGLRLRAKAAAAPVMAPVLAPPKPAPTRTAPRDEYPENDDIPF